MPIVDTTGWAAFNTNTGGSGDLTLTSVAVDSPDDDATVRTYYYCEAADGAVFEYGICAVLDGNISERQVIASSSGTSRVILPRSGVTVYLSPPFAETANTVSADDIPVGEIPADRIAGGELKTPADVKADLNLPTSAKDVVLIWHRSGIANGTHPVHLKAKWPFTINSMVHSGSEALTVTPKIGSTDITGLASTAVTTSTAEATATAANTVAENDAFNVAVADIATTADVRLEFYCTRT